MTLTETATITKRFLRVFIIFGSAFLILWLAFLYIYNNIVVPYQRSQQRPENRFGALPKPNYPASLLSSSSLSYSLDTKSGGLPGDIPRLINIYFIPPAETTLLSPDRARLLATSLGFPDGPEILSPTQYNYKDATGGTMQIDLSNSNFSFKRLPVSRPDLLQDEFLPDREKITILFRAYLNQKGLIKTGLEKGPVTVIYNNGDERSAATATVSLWPDPVDDKPVVTGDPKVGLISGSITKYQDELLRIPSLQYIFWPLDNQTFSTYPLITASEAYTKLQQGLGIVVRNETRDSKASITNIYLAYYMPGSYSSFLVPVFVFEGEQFTAYVPALTAESYAE